MVFNRSVGIEPVMNGSCSRYYLVQVSGDPQCKIVNKLNWVVPISYNDRGNFIVKRLEVEIFKNTDDTNFPHSVIGSDFYPGTNRIVQAKRPHCRGVNQHVSRVCRIFTAKESSLCKIQLIGLHHVFVKAHEVCLNGVA